MSIISGKKFMEDRWRPMMAFMYMWVCLFDFFIAPVLWSILQAIDHGSVTTQWAPITLGSGGLFHLSMGAICGVAAYGRTQEKVAVTNNLPISQEQTENKG